MKLKAIIITFLTFTVIVFLLSQFVFSPAKGFTRNMTIAVMGGLIYVGINLLMNKRKKQNE